MTRGPRCGAWMPRLKDWCARAAGHRAKHHSRALMERYAEAARARYEPSPETARQEGRPK